MPGYMVPRKTVCQMNAAKVLHPLPSPTTENTNSDVLQHVLQQPFAKTVVSSDGDA
jgi:hypothetical protein